MMRLWIVSVCDGRIMVSAYMPNGTNLSAVDLSVTKLDAALSLLRQELSEEIAREEVPLDR